METSALTEAWVTAERGQAERHAAIVAAAERWGKAADRWVEEANTGQTRESRAELAEECNEALRVLRIAVRR